MSITNAESGTVVEYTYDYMDCRATKKVTVNGTVTLHHRYLYRGYLQVACCDLTRSAHPSLWLICWDPSQTTATRPLAIQKDGTWYTYGWDLTKNICEEFGQHGYIRTTYNYTPYGQVTAAGDVTQPIRWSSEYHDTELALVYYNYRHYNPQDGSWLGRDFYKDAKNQNLYSYIFNNSTFAYDVLGLVDFSYKELVQLLHVWGVTDFTYVDNTKSKQICNKYNDYLPYKCFCDGKKDTDPYLKKAAKVCLGFVEQYSNINNKVIKPVECVASCLTNKEEDFKQISQCSERNAARLRAHVECYLECKFFLLSPDTFWMTSDAFEVGVSDVAPDFVKEEIKKEKNRVKASIKERGEKIDSAIKLNRNSVIRTHPIYGF